MQLVFLNNDIYGDIFLCGLEFYPLSVCVQAMIQMLSLCLSGWFLRKGSPSVSTWQFPH